jgi:hypothetical protein
LNFKYVLNIGPNGIRNFCRIIRYELGDTIWTRDADDLISFFSFINLRILPSVTLGRRVLVGLRANEVVDRAGIAAGYADDEGSY